MFVVDPIGTGGQGDRFQKATTYKNLGAAFPVSAAVWLALRTRFDVGVSCVARGPLLSLLLLPSALKPSLALTLCCDLIVRCLQA